MNRKHMVLKSLLLAVLVLGIPGAIIAADTQYEANNITIQLGSDASQLNFTWFTEDEQNNCMLAVANKKHLKHGEFTRKVDYYEGEIEEVDVEEQTGGPGGGTPPDVMTAAVETADTEEEEEAPVYSCKVTGVKVNPNQEYAYAVGNGVDFSDIYSIKTQNPSGFNFTFVGDPQIGASKDVDSDSEGWEDCLEAALGKFEKANFILSAGDQVESSTSSSQYNGFFGKFVKDEEAGEAQQHQMLTSIPFAPTIGNHDTSELYAYHFNVPNESEDKGCTDGGCDYWFTYDNTLFMVLNTNNSSAELHSEFMEEAIAAHPDARWKVVVFHHSLYSSASHITDVNSIRTGLAPVIGDNDIDVVLAGHDHFYARSHQLVSGADSEVCYETEDRRTGEMTETCVELTDEVVPEDLLTYNKKGAVVDPIGTVYFTANSASGSKFYTLNDIDGYTNTYLAAYDATKTTSYLHIEVKGGTLTVSAYSVDSGEMIDTYSIHKDDDRKRHQLNRKSCFHPQLVSNSIEHKSSKEAKKCN